LHPAYQVPFEALRRTTRDRKYVVDEMQEVMGALKDGASASCSHEERAAVLGQLAERLQGLKRKARTLRTNAVLGCIGLFENQLQYKPSAGQHWSLVCQELERLYDTCAKHSTVFLQRCSAWLHVAPAALQLAALAFAAVRAVGSGGGSHQHYCAALVREPEGP